eukprot:9731703-Prorocentrum_lima.AAC.1
MCVNSDSISRGEITGMPSSGIRQPNPKLSACVVAKDRHIGGSLIGVPMRTPRAVRVERNCGVRERHR